MEITISVQKFKKVKNDKKTEIFTNHHKNTLLFIFLPSLTFSNSQGNVGVQKMMLYSFLQHNMQVDVL